MRKIISPFRAVGLVLLLACMGTALVAGANNSKDKDSSKSSTASKTQSVWSATGSTKTPLKRETLPIPTTKLTAGGRSSESLRTASQTLFGYNGLQGNNVGGFNNGYNGFGGQFGFSPSYVNGGVGGRGNGFNQFSQLGNGYNVLDQTQGSFFGGQGQNPYYTNNYFGGQGGFNGYPYSSTGGIGGGFPFGSPQGGFGFGGFGNQGFYPGGSQFQGQVGSRNFGFVNQGFGNPAFRNPQGGVVSSGSFNSIPSSVQVGTGLEVGSRGFSGGAGNTGGFPSASGQQYIVGNGIGQPAFIGAAAPPSTFGFGGPYGGMYSAGVPGGLYRQQNSIFGPYDYPRSLSGTPSPSSVTSRPSSAATRLQTSGPNRFYQGVGPGGTYAPNSRERLYRFTTSNESKF